MGWLWDAEFSIAESASGKGISCCQLHAELSVAVTARVLSTYGDHGYVGRYIVRGAILLQLLGSHPNSEDFA